MRGRAKNLLREDKRNAGLSREGERLKIKEDGRGDGEDVLYAGCVSPACFLSSWDAVLV